MRNFIAVKKTIPKLTPPFPDLFDNVGLSSDIAMTVGDSEVEGLFFVPAFSGLQAPINDVYAGAGLIGLKPHHGKREILRSVLEAIAFGMMQLMEVMLDECSFVTAGNKIG